MMWNDPKPPGTGTSQPKLPATIRKSASTALSPPRSGMAIMVNTAISQYMPHMSRVRTMNMNLPSILKALVNPSSIPRRTEHIFPHTLFLLRHFHTAQMHTATTATAAETIHHRLKSSIPDTGFHMFSTKKLPNLSHPATSRSTATANIVSRSHPLSSTTVPSTLSYVATPALTSPATTFSALTGCFPVTVLSSAVPSAPDTLSHTEDPASSCPADFP